MLIFQRIATYEVTELRQCWIFVVTEYTDYWRVSFNKIVERMKTSKTYPLGHKTPNKTLIAPRDEVVFYRSGEDGKEFIGSAVISSVVRSSDKIVFGYVHFSKIKIWQESVDLYNILHELSFIKNKRRWQCYFQGGIRKIPRKDYERILKSKDLTEST